MSQKKFEHNVDDFLATQKAAFDRAAAKRALLLLYEYIENRAKDLTQCAGWTLEWCKVLYQVQQVICWSPLRVFIKVLATDELLAIRAAAKGELADRTGEFWGDPESGIMGRVNMFMITGQLDALDPSSSLPPVVALDSASLPDSTSDLGRELYKGHLCKGGLCINKYTYKYRYILIRDVCYPKIIFVS